MRRSEKAGAAGIAAAMVVLAAATGCSGSSGDSASKACGGGRYTWSNVSQRSTLTHMTTLRAHHKGEGISSRYAHEIARYTAAVRTTAGPELPASEVIHALSGKVGGPLAGEKGYATTSRYDGSGYARSRAEAPGRYVAARAIERVEADFRYRCAAPGEDAPTTRGHVATFQVGDQVGVVFCGSAPDRKEFAGIREAARLGCHEGDPGRGV
ncbi:hypothetical protein [Streptomyces palmae]|uniref:Lipoprotein n=1 Tax=Streptomyces palmae TaxID=1701085 RepID=A0A4Z0H715_9ACTN|nr:hypothetical protein [Streptomyces palmae]TGB09308.1 hypothetical protein E4099_13925 [Streptomyces palmae]